MTPEHQPLIEDICRWDFHSVELLYDRYYRALVSYALQMVPQDTAEDVVQEIFATAWERKPVFSYEAQLTAYLYNATHNMALNHLRHENVETAYRQQVLSNQNETPTDDSAETIYKEEVYRQLFEAIDQLPPRQREIFLLAMDGKKNREIATQLHISAETVKVQKRRAVIALHNKLAPEALLMFLAMANQF